MSILTSKARAPRRETHKMMLDHPQQTKNMRVSYDTHAAGLF